jgi:hypothetical protein
MAAVEPARERVARRLQDAVDRVRQDMEQVEFWTEVLGCLTRPAPDYNAGTNVLNRFALPERHSDDAARMRNLDANQSGEKTKAHASDKRSNARGTGH